MTRAEMNKTNTGHEAYGLIPYKCRLCVTGLVLICLWLTGVG